MSHKFTNQVIRCVLSIVVNSQYVPVGIIGVHRDPQFSETSSAQQLIKPESFNYQGDAVPGKFP